MKMIKKTLLLTIAVLLFAGLGAWRLLTRRQAEANKGDPHSSVAAVARAERRNITRTLTIAGEFTAYQDVDVHAKVAGYIRAIYVDVGTHVNAGQLLAVLEIPELAAQLDAAEASVRAAQDQIRRAEGELQRARSVHFAAHDAYVRLKLAADSRAGLVAQQEVDDSQAKDLGSQAQVESAEAQLAAVKQQFEVARANQKQYAALSGYTHIVAPFAGVITNRYADIGTLVAAGTSSSTQAIPVVRLAQISVLRLVLPIPESVAAQIHLGQAVNVRVQALNRAFEGNVSRFADSLNRQTRTMDTQIDVINRDGSLIPGMYSQTTLILGEKKGVLTIPLEAATRNGEEATVLAVSAQNTVRERHVQLGLEDPARVEVLSGLSPGDRVLLGNRSQFRDGQKIQPVEVNDTPGETERPN